MNEAVLAVLGAVVAVLLLLAGLWELTSLARQRRDAVRGATAFQAERRAAGAHELKDRFEASRPGRWLAHELDVAGIRQSPSLVATLAASGALVATWLIAQLLAPGLAVLGIGAGFLGLRGFLRRAQDRRTQAFVNQLPDLARVMANATGAGLSLPTAISMAADELAEPARTELSRMEARLRFGAPLESVLDGLRERVPSREVSVLMSTLLVASRAGGSMVTALREIADSLEDRKETRREVTTILSQSTATAWLVIVMGMGMLLLLNLMWPGTVDKMVRQPLGQGALVVGIGLFAVGFLAIRRMTRIDL